MFALCAALAVMQVNPQGGQRHIVRESRLRHCGKSGNIALTFPAADLRPLNAAKERIERDGVFRPAAGAFTVEGANVGEAAVALKGKVLVGVYVAAEDSFMPSAEQ